MRLWSSVLEGAQADPNTASRRVGGAGRAGSKPFPTSSRAGRSRKRPTQARVLPSKPTRGLEMVTSALSVASGSVPDSEI